MSDERYAELQEIIASPTATPTERARAMDEIRGEVCACCEMHHGPGRGATHTGRDHCGWCRDEYPTLERSPR
jgi:hypothetical protein